MFKYTSFFPLFPLLAFHFIGSADAQAQPAVEKFIAIPDSKLIDNLDISVADGSGNFTVTCHSCDIVANISVAAGGPSLGGARGLPTNWKFDVQDVDLTQDWVALSLPNQVPDTWWVKPNFTVECDPGSAGFCQGRFTLSKKGGNGIESPLEIAAGLTVTTPVVFDIRVNASKLVNFGMAFVTYGMSGTLLVPLAGGSRPRLIGMDNGIFAPTPREDVTGNYTILSSSTEGLELDVSVSVRLELHYTLAKDGGAPVSSAYAAEIPRFSLSARQVNNATNYCQPPPKRTYIPIDVYDNLTNLTRTVSNHGLIIDGAEAGQTFDTNDSFELGARCYSYDNESKSLVQHTGARMMQPMSPAAARYGTFVASTSFFTLLSTIFVLM